MRDAEQYAAQDQVRRDGLAVREEAQRLLGEVGRALGTAGKHLDKEEKKAIKNDEAALRKLLAKKGRGRGRRRGGPACGRGTTGTVERPRPKARRLLMRRHGQERPKKEAARRERAEGLGSRRPLPLEIQTMVEPYDT